MGPVRRQLILLVLGTGPAMAEVCTAVRPAWVPGDGAVSAFGEVVQFLLWGGGAVVILALLAGFYWRKSIVLSGVMLVTLVMAVPYLWPLDPTTRVLAMAEGCVGPAAGVIGVLGAIWIAAVAGQLFKRKVA